MRTEEKKQLKAKSGDELKKLISDEAEKLRVLRFDFAAGKIKNFSEIWKTKKRIAVALTFLGQKQVSADNSKVK